MIKWAWLETLYLMDVFHVVYEAICAPPPAVLESHPNFYQREALGSVL